MFTEPHAVRNELKKILLNIAKSLFKFQLQEQDTLMSVHEVLFHLW